MALLRAKDKLTKCPTPGMHKFRLSCWSVLSKSLLKYHKLLHLPSVALPSPHTNKMEGKSLLLRTQYTLDTGPRDPSIDIVLNAISPERSFYAAREGHANFHGGKRPAILLSWESQQ